MQKIKTIKIIIIIIIIIIKKRWLDPCMKLMHDNDDRKFLMYTK